MQGRLFSSCQALGPSLTLAVGQMAAPGHCCVDLRGPLRARRRYLEAAEEQVMDKERALCALDEQILALKLLSADAAPPCLRLRSRRNLPAVGASFAGAAVSRQPARLRTPQSAGNMVEWESTASKEWLTVHRFLGS